MLSADRQLQQMRPEAYDQHSLGAVVLDRDRLNSLVRYLRCNGGSGVRIYSGDGLNKRYVEDLNTSTINELQKIKITVRNPAITLRFGPGIALVSVGRPSAKANALVEGVQKLTARYQYPIIPYRKAATIFLLSAVWAASLIGLHYHLSMWVESFSIIISYPTVLYPAIIAIATGRRIKRQGISRIQRHTPAKNSVFAKEMGLNISAMACGCAMVIAFAISNIVIWRVTGRLL